MLSLDYMHCKLYMCTRYILLHRAAVYYRSSVKTRFRILYSVGLGIILGQHYERGLKSSNFRFGLARIFALQ